MTKQTRIPLCIVGCGGYAKIVLDNIHDMTDVVELYFASRDLYKAKTYSDDYGGSGYFGSYEEAAMDPRIQAMYFFTPHDLHLENVKLAACHGKHILLEKPIGRIISECEDIIKTACDANVKLMVAENFRFLPTIGKCKELISQGVIGELRVVRAEHEGYDTGSVAGWRTSIARSGGGRFIDGGVHYVDIMVALAGVPESVYALTESPKVIPDHEGEDGIMVMARLPNNVTGLIHYSGGTPVNKPYNWVQITGTTGTLGFHPHGGDITLYTSVCKAAIQVGSDRIGVRGMVKEFRNCIIDDRESIMSGPEALKDLAVVLAAYRSAQQGTPIAVSARLL